MRHAIFIDEAEGMKNIFGRGYHRGAAADDVIAANTLGAGYVTGDGHGGLSLFDGEANGVVGTALEAGLELKNPLLTTHTRYVMKPEALLNDYRPQVQGCLLISGLPQWELYSYCPPLPAVHLTIKPDEYTTKLHTALADFVLRYNEAMNKVLGYGIGEMLARLHSDDAYSDVA